MYADRVTDSMAEAIAETERRPRGPGRLQRRPRHHAGVDRTSIRELLQTVYERDYYTVEVEETAETFAAEPGGAGRGASPSWRRR